MAPWVWGALGICFLPAEDGQTVWADDGSDPGYPGVIGG